jgi:hypothetical protein
MKHRYYSIISVDYIERFGGSNTALACNTIKKSRRCTFARSNVASVNTAPYTYIHITGTGKKVR